MKKIIFFLLLFLNFSACTASAQFDSSIDAEIRKKYNIEELPPLPSAEPSKPKMPEKIKNYNASGKTYTLKSGAEIILVSQNKVSNWNREGFEVSFLLNNEIMTEEGAVIPAGTVFKGALTDSHAPQITGNGGLIKLKIDRIYYNGVMSVINTKLAEAASKKVYRSSIKGRRKYLNNCSKAMTPGRKTFKAMKKAADTLSPYPVINILGIAPLAIGSCAYIINLPIAPIASVFMKGGSITLPPGSIFRIKILGKNKIQG